RQLQWIRHNRRRQAVLNPLQLLFELLLAERRLILQRPVHAQTAPKQRPRQDRPTPAGIAQLQVDKAPVAIAKGGHDPAQTLRAIELQAAGTNLLGDRLLNLPAGIGLEAEAVMEAIAHDLDRIVL